jgi:hypothetical protein
MLCQTKCYDATFVFFSTPRFNKHKAIIQPWHYPLVPSHFSTLAFSPTLYFIKPQTIIQPWNLPKQNKDI